MNKYEAHKSNPEVFKQFSIKDILFVYYKCPQKEKIIELYSPYNQFTFSLGGKKIMHQGDRTWTVSKDQAFLLRRTAYFEELHEDLVGWEILAFYLKDEYLKKLFEEFRADLPLNNLPPTPSEMVIMISVDDRIRNCYYSLIPYFKQQQPLPESIIELKFIELLYNIFIHPKNQGLLAYLNSLVDNYIVPVWQVMESNFMYDLSIAEYALLANRTLASFKREFKEYYKVTPRKWLLKRRLERAKLYLDTTNKPIGEIAFENGFKNLSYFSRIFKEHIGISPTIYRKKENIR